MALQLIANFDEAPDRTPCLKEPLNLRCLFFSCHSGRLTKAVKHRFFTRPALTWRDLLCILAVNML